MVIASLKVTCKFSGKNLEGIFRSNAILHQIIIVDKSDFNFIIGVFESFLIKEYMFD